MRESPDRSGPALVREGVSGRGRFGLDTTVFETLSAAPRTEPSERHRIARWLGCWAGRSTE